MMKGPFGIKIILGVAIARGGLVFDASLDDPSEAVVSAPIAVETNRTLNKKKQDPFGWPRTIMRDYFSETAMRDCFSGSS